MPDYCVGIILYVCLRGNRSISSSFFYVVTLKSNHLLLVTVFLPPRCPMAKKEPKDYLGGGGSRFEKEPKDNYGVPNDHNILLRIELNFPYGECSH